jgi:hypothetical protein
MAKILFHLGLPKTATTTLQEEFFVHLHRKGKINYIGKRGDYDAIASSSNTEKLYHEVYRKHLYRLRFGTDFFLEDAKKQINSCLDKNKLNVISDENFFFAFQNEHNHTQVFDEKLAQRFDDLFSEHSLRAFCVLRRQSDYLYSWYNYHYPKIWFYTKDDNTIDKYYENLISHFSEKKEMFCYGELMTHLKKRFSKLSCLFFEELLLDKFSYYKKIADLLGVKITTKDIPSIHLKQSKKTNLGTKTLPATQPEVFQNTNYKFFLFKILGFMKKIIKTLIKYTIFCSEQQKSKIQAKLTKLGFFMLNISGQKIQPYLTEKQQQTIMELCKKSNEKLISEKFCTKQNLEKYHYL